jgi:transcriptional regulator with XRE-family HTH domain
VGGTLEPKAALGRVVRERRVEQGLSQEQLAHAARLHRNYVGGIERGERNPAYLNLLKLASALDLSASELLAQAEALIGERS